MGRKALSVTVLLTLFLVAMLTPAINVTPTMTSAASDVSAPPTVEWSQTYGGEATDRAYSVQQTRDGGYIISGTHGTNYLLLKINSTGGMEWNKLYEIGWFTLCSAQQTSDGGYVMGGTAENSSGDGCYGWILKTDSAGGTQWSKTYSKSATGTDFAYCIQQTSDGGYILAGSTKGVGPYSMDAWLLKTDSAGSMQWSKTIHGGGADSQDRANSIQQTSDGGYVFAGQIWTNMPSTDDFWLVKTDSAGGTQWSQIYGKGIARSAQQTRDGGYIVAGNTEDPLMQDASLEDGWVIKTNSTGAVQWNKTVIGASIDEFWSVRQTSDGGYITGGWTSGNGPMRAWLVKMNSTGSTEWNQMFNQGQGVWASSVQETSDGGYAVAGAAYTSLANTYDVWLMKLAGQDADGDGLLDTWEQNGIDYDGDGKIDLTLPGADYQKKDIFVEVDYMQGQRLSNAARDQVIEAFQNAPEPINLHIEIDDADNIPYQYSIKADADTGNWPGFDSIKINHFGTPAQHNNITVWNAKRLAYHYCLMIHYYEMFNATSSTWYVTGSSGLSEPYGNDFIVSLGSFTDGVGTVEEQAGTFMHELGHNLGLQHGGGDDINYKPNYLSVMNYFFQTPVKLMTRPLDYSRVAQPTLNEKDLDESAGIGAVAYWPSTVFSAPVLNVTSGYYRYVPLPVSTLGAIDWNNNGEDNETSVRANLNLFPQKGWEYISPPDETLTGYDDWANLRFNFKDTKGFPEGVHPTDFGVDELTWDTVEAMRESFSQLHEVDILNVTSSSNVWQQGTSVTLNFTLGNLGGSDETFNVTVYANTTAVASANFTIKAGTFATKSLPFLVQTLAAGNYKLKATVNPVANEVYRADNTVTGVVVSVTDVIPEFPPEVMLAALIIMTLAVALGFKKESKSKRTSIELASGNH